MEYAIETYGLTKKFIPARSFSGYLRHPLRKEKPILAVNNLTMKIKRGELFVLLGPNGAGKTTLLKILSCLILPTSGNATVLGHDLLKDEDIVRTSIGLISGNERSFYWRLTLRQNLSFFAALYNLNNSETRKIIKELGYLLQIEDVLDRQFQECSAGIKQRLAVARGLLNDPEVLFMDEPVKSLDAALHKNLDIFIKDRLVRERGKTVIVTTHNLFEAEQIADRIAIMHKGELKACGTLDEMRNAVGDRQGSLEAIYLGVTQK